jgi:glycosyltransferase involved in cell wall biosynthesis
VAESAAEQVEAVCALLRDAERARVLGRAARAFVEANYDWEQCLQPVDAILEKVTQR